MSAEAKRKISHSLSGKPKPKKTYHPEIDKSQLMKLYKQYSIRQISKLTHVTLGKVRYMFQYYKITITKTKKQS